MGVYIFNHPLIEHKLTKMRCKETETAEFRRLLTEITMLMVCRVTEDLETEVVEIETPVAKANVRTLSGEPLVLVPILRAGLGMVEGFTSLVPNARIGHLGMYRDPVTHLPVPYYSNMPKAKDAEIVVLDPMLATGGSANEAIAWLKNEGFTHIRMVNLVAAPEGIKAVTEAHPDVDIYVAACDEKLNDHAYIVPGLGDAGDRLFGTL